MVPLKLTHVNKNITFTLHDLAMCSFLIDYSFELVLYIPKKNKIIQTPFLNKNREKKQEVKNDQNKVKDNTNFFRKTF